MAIYLIYDIILTSIHMVYMFISPFIPVISTYLLLFTSILWLLISLLSPSRSELNCYLHYPFFFHIYKFLLFFEREQYKRIGVSLLLYPFFVHIISYSSLSTSNIKGKLWTYYLYLKAQQTDENFFGQNKNQFAAVKMLINAGKMTIFVMIRNDTILML